MAKIITITDPPYNVDLKYNDYKDNRKLEDYIEFNSKWLALAKEFSDAQIVFTGNVNTKMWIEQFNPDIIGIWNKGEGATTHGKITNYTAWEPIFFHGEFKRKRHTDVFNYVARDTKQDHPCPKPIKLIADLIVNFTEPDDIILDLFGGSGSTLIACEQTNRICYMMEIDERYCDVIRERYNNFVDKQETNNDGKSTS